MLASRKQSQRFSIVVAAVCCIAIVLVLAALLVPVIAYLVNPYRGYKNVIARFKLSNGMVLEYVIEEDKYDIAATNFIFLAKNGYFDNTVFFDAQNGWLRFGGYEDQPSYAANSSGDYSRTKHHAQNEKYCSGFKALPNDRFDKSLDKFGYNLYSDANGETTALLEQIGVLTYLYSDTSTEFQFAYTAQANNLITRLGSDGKKSTGTLLPTMVGYALDDKTVDNLIALAETAAENTSISYGYLWTPPSPTVRIDSVKVYNLDSEKWRNFDFVEYMNSEDNSGRRRLRGWTGQV